MDRFFDAVFKLLMLAVLSAATFRFVLNLMGY